MKKILLVIGFLITSQSYSQYVEGVVLDAKTHEPIENVSVYMDEIDRGTTTNVKGFFYLTFPAEIVKSGTVLFSHVKYKELKVSFFSKKKNYKVFLVEDVTNLREIQISRTLKKNIDYKELSSMKVGRCFFGAQLVNNKIYAVGGNSSSGVNGMKKALDLYPDITDFRELLKKVKPNYSKTSFRNDMLIYNIETDKWEKKKEVEFRKRGFHSLNYYDNKLYILGGKRLSKNRKIEYLDDKIEVYNIKNDSILVYDTNPHQAVNFASFSIDKKLVFIGGSIEENKSGIKKYMSKVHSFDIETGLWYEIGNMPIPKETNGVVVDNKIYLIGGYNKKPLRTIETFDLKTGKWDQVGELNFNFNSEGVTSNKEIIFLYDNGKISTFNTKDNKLKTYNINLKVKSAKLFYSNNKLYILGGYVENEYSIYPSRRFYSVDVNEFQITRVITSKVL